MKYYSLTAHRNACALLVFLLVAVAACSAKSTRDVTAGTPTPKPFILEWLRFTLTAVHV